MGKIKQFYSTKNIEKNPQAQLYALPKRIQREVHNSCERNAKMASDDKFIYLWVFVTEAGIARTENQPADTQQLTLEQWLNVIDEAASLGVNWFVVGVKSGNFTQNPEIWEMCRWAQDTYGIIVGLQTNAPGLLQEELEEIKKLNPELTRVMVSDSAKDKACELENLGFKLCVPNDNHHHEEDSLCTKPGNMVFVNAAGVIYTCGLVEGQDKYRLGTVLEDEMRKVLKDPDLPHTVPNDTIPNKKHGCDGCPPLMIRYFEEAERRNK